MTTGEHSVDELECLAGRILDRRYLLERYIARGAFGVVYRGIDQKFNSPVAVKIGRSYREFTKEARLAAEVRHPHIVQVTDYGLDGGFAYLVMEFLEGDDLEKLMLRPDHPVNAALLKKLVAEVGDALSHAHSVNLVHRDLKPRNIILRNSSGHANDSESPGRFVLVDFGIAAKLDAQGTQRNATFDGAGTAEYMAPELLRASPVATPRSDIYAFGTIMYQLMTGRVPFPQCDGSHLALADCLNAIANDPAPEFSSVIPNRHYPSELEALVLQCLEKDPARRPQTIEEVRERFLSGFYPEMGTGDFSQTLRPGGFVETKRIRGKTGRNAPVPAPSRWTSNAVAMIALGVCIFTLAITLRRNQPEPHRRPETRPLPLAATPPTIQETSSVTTAEEVQPVPRFIVGGAVEPADARLTANEVPISLNPVPVYRLAGTVDPADAEVTINGQSVAVVDGAWNWQTTEIAPANLKASRAQFADIERTVEVQQNGTGQLVLDPILTVTPNDATVTESGRPLVVENGKVRIPIAPKASVIVTATLNQDSTTFTLTRNRVRELNHQLQVNVSPPVVTPVPLTTPASEPNSFSQSSSQLQNELNALCVDMWKTYRDDTEEFDRSYRELFELLQISRKMNASLAKGEPPALLKAQLLTISAEVHHAEHHVKEFGERPGISEATRQRLSEKFEKVEATLAGLITSPELKGDVEQAPAAPREVNWTAIRPSVGAVHNRAKSVCTSLFKAYHSDTDEFQECYKNATEMRLLAEKLERDVGKGTTADNAFEQLTQIAERIHHLESDVPALAKSNGSTESIPFKSIMIMIRHIQSDVHKLLDTVRSDDQHGDADADEKAVDDKAKNSTPAELAGELRDLSISLANALDDDYRQNPGFRKAYNETLEFRETCEEIKKGIVGDALNPEALKMVARLDGDIHHIEEHLNGFKSDASGVKEARSRAKRKMHEVEITVHALMKRTGIKNKHAD